MLDSLTLFEVHVAPIFIQGVTQLVKLTDGSETAWPQIGEWRQQRQDEAQPRQTT